MDSIQHKLCKVRPSRVRLTFDVEVGDSIKEITLPFVILVIGNFSGHNNETNTMKNNPVNIIMSTLDSYMAELRPFLKFSVDNVLNDNGGRINVVLHFSKTDDLEVLNIVNQVSELREFYNDSRSLLEVAALADGNDELHDALTSLQKNTGDLDELIADIDAQLLDHGG